jgi:CspA family cold shock protein
MTAGVVKWFNPVKGYGFIEPDGDTDKDIFVHITEVKKAGLSKLSEGQRLEFQLSDFSGKIIAANIQVLEEAVA